MAAEVGQVVQGRVTRMLPYGVLVQLEDGTTGLVHISEIDQNYVRDVNDYFQNGDDVTVKVLRLDDRGKIELSVKQALAPGQTLTPRQNTGEENNNNNNGAPPRDAAPSRRESRASFEEKMSDFMRSSSERLGDLKRNIENKRGGKKTR
jgi:S1 RNA binding domain protein